MSNLAPSPFFNIYSPFSRPVIYVGRENKGFALYAASDDAPDGWGFPLANSSGQPILPGTPGGPAPVKFLGKSGTKPWGCRHTPGTQAYGNISWLGKVKDAAKPSKGKWVLTYNGPNTRCLPSDSFSYGTDDTHNDIYCEGLCITVAPGHVLGAALYFPTPDAPKPTLRVVCWENGEDVMYARELIPTMGVDGDSYTDEFRQEQMKTYLPDLVPEGWRRLGYFQCTSSSQGSSRTVKGPRTPWFFDSTGTVAQCMREADITFNRGDTEVTQQGYVRYKLTVDGEGASLSVPDNTEGFTFTVKNTVEAKDDYTAVTRYPAVSNYGFRSHWWRVHKITSVTTCTGTYVVAVDYHDTEERLVTVEAKILCDLTQWVYKGIDDTYDPGIPNPQNNTDDVQGDFYSEIYDPAFVPYEGDGVSALWSQNNSGYYLRGANFKPNAFIYRRLSGTKSEFDTGVRASDDYYLYFFFDVKLFPHYLSLARTHMSAFCEQKVMQKADFFESEMEYYTKHKEIEYASLTTFMEKNKDAVDRDPGYVYPAISQAWLNTQLEAHWMGGVDNTTIFRSIDGAFPDDYVWPTSEPDPRDFYYNSEFRWDEGWPTIPDLLQSISKGYREGQHAEDSLEHFCVSMKYLDEKDEEKYYNALDGATGTLESNTSASGDNTRFYPLGEM